MPISLRHYTNPNSVNNLIEGYVDKILNIIGDETGNGWRYEELD